MLLHMAIMIGGSGMLTEEHIIQVYGHDRALLFV
jgi:hypothetical protein